jgi:predicted metal-binding protein
VNEYELPEHLSAIDPERAAAALDSDSERYLALALKLGASDVRVVEAAAIPIDDRVLLKCRVPRCSSYGACANCPPGAPSPDEMRRLLQLYRTALVFRIAGDPALFVPGEQNADGLSVIRRDVYAVSAGVESAAFYDGHYYAAGFASGSCRTLFCAGLECAALSGAPCRHGLKARPAMEATGVDCFALAGMLGWTIYPIGKSPRISPAPAAFLMGMVLVG